MANVLITSELEQGSELHWEHTLAHESELIGVQFRGLTLNRYVVKILFFVVVFHFKFSPSTWPWVVYVSKFWGDFPVSNGYVMHIIVWELIVDSLRKEIGVPGPNTILDVVRCVLSLEHSCNVTGITRHLCQTLDDWHLSWYSYCRALCQITGPIVCCVGHFKFGRREVSLIYSNTGLLQC